MADNEVSTTKQPQTVNAILASDAFQQQIARALPSHMTGDRMLRVAATAVRRNPKLGQCTPGSFAACMLTLSAAGLEPDGRRAHLIPYKDECTVIIDYKGLVELALRNGDIATIHADVVCDRDDFEFDLGQVTRHRVNLRESRGEPYAAYALVTKKDGSRQACVMSRDEIESVRKRSRSGQSGPWTTDWCEMAKKTVFRRLSKWLVLSPEIRDLVEAEDGEYQQPQQTAVQGKGMAKLAGLMQQPAVEEPAFVDVTEEVTGGS
jgi:recombination protein RecT